MTVDPALQEMPSAISVLSVDTFKSPVVRQPKLDSPRRPKRIPWGYCEQLVEIVPTAQWGILSLTLTQEQRSL